MTSWRTAALPLLLLLFSAVATAQPPPASIPGSVAVSTAGGRKSSPPLTAAVAATDLQDIRPWDEEGTVAELGDAFDIDDDDDDEGRVRRRASPALAKSGAGDGGGGCQLLMAGRDVRRRMSRSELRRLLRNLVKEHHAFHLPGKRGGVARPLCRYGKRGQWRPCSLHYKRLQSRRPYAYHWPIMNILGGALG